VSALVRPALAVALVLLLLGATTCCGADGDDIDEFRTGAARAAATD